MNLIKSLTSKLTLNDKVVCKSCGNQSYANPHRKQSPLSKKLPYIALSVYDLIIVVAAFLIVFYCFYMMINQLLELATATIASPELDLLYFIKYMVGAIAGTFVLYLFEV